MVDYLIYLFDDVATWVKLSSFVIGLVTGLLFGVLGIAAMVQRGRESGYRASGFLYRLDFLVGAVFTLVCWLVLATLSTFLAASLIYATWPVSLWVIICLVVVGSLGYWRFRTDPRTLR